jgi:nucleoside-diphosphate-sugar epimerase
MRILVTGGMGFIGSHLVKKLHNSGHTVDIVDNLSTGREDRLSQIDIRNSFPGLLYRKEERNFIRYFKDDFAGYILDTIATGVYDTIYHLAAIPQVSFSIENPAETSENNLNKTIQLFDAARIGQTRVVFSSSCAVYGNTENLPVNENEVKIPISPYAWQKSACEDVAKLFCNLYESSDIVCLRYFNVYGPEQYGDSPYASAVSAWCHAIKNNRSCRSDGDGTQSRDMCYVDDVVSANILASKKSKRFTGECYNIASGKSVTNNEILDYFSKNFEINIKHAPRREGDIYHMCADISKSRKDLGYEPKIEFLEGLEKTIKWWGLK